MLAYLLEMCRQAIADFPGALGSNWLGMLFPVFSAVVTFSIVAIRQGWRTVLRSWKRPTKVGLISATIGYGLLFLGLFFSSIYKEHQKLSVENKQLRDKLTGNSEPGLSLKIGGIVFGAVNNDSTRLQVALKAYNSGWPTTVHDWRIEVRSKKITLAGIHMPGFPLATGSFDVPRLDVALQKPIEQYVEMPGVVVFMVPHFSYRRMQNLSNDPSSEIVVTTVDSRGNSIRSERKIIDMSNELHFQNNLGVSGK